MNKQGFRHLVSNYNPTADKTINEILNDIGKNAFPLSIGILAIPCCIPIPMPPGYTTIFGVLIGLLSIQWMLGYKTPKLPQFLSNKRISKEKIEFITIKSDGILERLEKFIKPRHNSVFSKNKFNTVLSIYFLINSIILSLPIPIGNVFSGFSILIGSISILEKDLIGLIISLLLSVLSLIFTLLIMAVGVVIFQSGLDFLFS
jgi:hypothetical protein